MSLNDLQLLYQLLKKLEGQYVTYPRFMLCSSICCINSTDINSCTVLVVIRDKGRKQGEFTVECAEVTVTDQWKLTYSEHLCMH